VINYAFIFLNGGAKLDDYLFKNYQILRKIGAYFFFIFSQITYFFLINSVGRFLVYSLLSLMVVTNFGNYVTIFYEIHEAGSFSLSVLIESCKNNLNGVFYAFFYMYFFLLEITVTNTLLVHCPSVVETIKQQFGNDILVERGYNSPLRSLFKIQEVSKIAAVILTGTTIGVTFFVMYDSHLYCQNYEKYIQAKIANPTLDIKAPAKGSNFSLLGFAKK